MRLNTSRRKSRTYLLQALYQWQLTAASLEDLQMQFHAAMQAERMDTTYFDQILPKVLTAVDALDAQLAPLLDRPLDRLGPIEHAILRLGAYELQYCADVPKKVAIDEAIHLAKTFAATDASKYINAVLDALAKALTVAQKS